MTKALIIGGGIGGAAVCMALRKAGIESVVYEAYPTGAESVGAFITVMSNGMSGLRAIDAHLSVIDHSFPVKGLTYISAKGKRIGGRPYEPHTKFAGLPRTMTRGRLVQLMYDEMADRRINIEYGKRLTDARTTPDGQVVACFEDGTDATGDLLVGADGIHSVTRMVIDREATVPRYTGLNILYGYTDETVPVGASTDTYQMMYGTRAFFGCITAPQGGTWWFARMPGDELTKAQLAETSAEEWRRLAIGFFTDDQTPAAQIIEAPGQVIAINSYDVPTVRRWHNESMVLIGDAAHAASPAAGQGASMTIEDSVVLAKCLRDLPSTAIAFRTYERLRRERVEQLVAWSANQDPVTPRWRPIRRFLHDLKIARKPEPATHPHSWLHDYRVDWESPVTS
jgi:2-polyprenyl-6-methoxyphenol hydroxylase-like FAD-dependent oxidoreductase